MKNKQSKVKRAKTKEDRPGDLKLASETPSAEVMGATEGVPPVELVYPPPEYVAEAARGEPSPRLVADYSEAIQILRDEKRLTFREIAEWLTKKFGIEADHNAVYRAYTRGMDEMQAALAARDDDEDERDVV
jgi:hypothetical protein